MGKAMAKILINAGADVTITGRDKVKLLKVAESLGAFPIHTDVSVEEEVLSCYEKFMNKFGKLDVLINNAGIGADRRGIDELDIETMRQVYAVNVFGAAMMGREAAKIFKKQNKGNIVNIASTASLNSYEGGSIYSSSKFALRSMSQSWQQELRKFNVRVFNINPSFVPTAFNQPERKEREEEYNKLTSMEIAQAVKFVLEMDDRGYVPELTVHATNPF